MEYFREDTHDKRLPTSCNVYFTIPAPVPVRQHSTPIHFIPCFHLSLSTHSLANQVSSSHLFTDYKYPTRRIAHSDCLFLTSEATLQPDYCPCWISVLCFLTCLYPNPFNRTVNWVLLLRFWNSGLCLLTVLRHWTPVDKDFLDYGFVAFCTVTMCVWRTVSLTLNIWFWIVFLSAGELRRVKVSGREFLRFTLTLTPETTQQMSIL